MENTLIVYSKADGRVRFVRSIQHGMPRVDDLSELIGIADGAVVYDDETMDYQVGVVNYEDGDFDLETGLLTTEAAEKYGIEEEEVDKYIKDREIVLPVDKRVLDLLYNDGTGAISEDAQPTIEQVPRLRITVDSVANTAPVGMEPDNMVQIYEVNEKVYPDGDCAVVTFKVEKLDAAGDPMTGAGDNETVRIYPSRGLIINNPSKFPAKEMVNGVMTFDLALPAESVDIDVIVMAIGIIEGRIRIKLGALEEE